MNTIRDILNERIQWRKQNDTTRWTDTVGGEPCELTMNDFPDEPLYTVTWRNETLDIDDAPECWLIPRS